MPCIGMIIRQLARLVCNRVGDFLTPIAHIHTVKTGKAIQQFVPVTVFDVRAARGTDDPAGGVAAGVPCQMGGWVKEILAIPLGQLIIM